MRHIAIVCIQMQDNYCRKAQVVIKKFQNVSLALSCSFYLDLKIEIELKLKAHLRGKEKILG